MMSRRITDVEVDVARRLGAIQKDHFQCGRVDDSLVELSVDLQLVGLDAS